MSVERFSSRWRQIARAKRLMVWEEKTRPCYRGDLQNMSWLEQSYISHCKLCPTGPYYYCPLALYCLEIFVTMLSVPIVFLKISSEWSTKLQNIWRRVVDRVWMNISPSNNFLKKCFGLKNMTKIIMAVLGTTMLKLLCKLCSTVHYYYCWRTSIFNPYAAGGQLANTKWCKNPGKWPKPWHVGTHLRVLSESYPMNTNLTGFRWFSRIFVSLRFVWK